MPFTDEEKARIRAHAGYINVSASQTFVGGVPAALETTFIIEGAMNKVLPEAEPIVRRLLVTLDSIEAQMFEDLELLAIEQIDEIKVRKDEQERLTDRYLWYVNYLCNILGVARNPFDKRFTDGGGINVGVQH